MGTPLTKLHLSLLAFFFLVIQFSESVQLQKSSTAHSTKREVKGLLIGWIVGVLSTLLFSFLIKVVVRRIRGPPEKDSGPMNSGTVIFSTLIKKKDLVFLEKEDEVASLEIIGRGGCGEVYRAPLSESNDGKMIAIKKVVISKRDSVGVDEVDSKLLSNQMNQIRSEIQTVGRIRHRNLVPLLAHVIREECHYLVYEYMKNGSLHDILKQHSEGTRELDWPSRYRISLGIAAGLEYLHMDHSPRIIHRDLKPANILLDDDMEARIADFGLAKSIPDVDTHIFTSNVAGTFGFIAPEYFRTSMFTDKCDIYSFGVLLAVLVIGKLPTDNFYSHTEEQNSIEWMRNVISSENPERAIDPKLLGNGYEVGGSHLGTDFTNQANSSMTSQAGSSMQVDRPAWIPGLQDNTAGGAQLSGPPPMPGQMGIGGQPPRPQQLTQEMEKALLQQVMSLTPEQLISCRQSKGNKYFNCSRCSVSRIVFSC